MGLWGRNHTITGPTEIHYAIIPHGGEWDDADISNQTQNWNEPLLASLSSEGNLKKSLVDATGTGYQITTVLVDGDDLLVRVFNAEGKSDKKQLSFGGNAEAAELIELNGTTKQKLNLNNNAADCEVDLSMPRFGVRTIRLKHFKAK
jgi:alpha-mannosidase